MQKTWVRPGLGISRGGGHGNPLQYSCLENPMNRGAWRATVHGSQRVGHNWASMHSTAAYIPLYNIPQFLFLFTYHGHLGYHPFGIISNKTLWTFVHKPSVNTFSFLSFLFISLLGSRMARSFDRWIFNFLREYETIFPSSCTWLSWLLYLYNVLKSEKVLQLLFFKLALVILCLYILIYFLE